MYVCMYVCTYFIYNQRPRITFFVIVYYGVNNKPRVLINGDRFVWQPLFNRLFHFGNGFNKNVPGNQCRKMNPRLK